MMFLSCATPIPRNSNANRQVKNKTIEYQLSIHIAKSHPSYIKILRTRSFSSNLILTAVRKCLRHDVFVVAYIWQSIGDRWIVGIDRLGD
jgi:hypothetical protein